MPVRVQLPITAVAAVLAGAILAFDLATPLGVAGAVPYVTLVLLGIWLHRQQIIWLAVLATLLTIAGYFLSPAGGIPWVVLTNRGLALFAIWVTALLLMHLKRAQQHRYQALEQLQHYLDTVNKYVITSSTDPRGIITSASDAFCKISGYSREELVGRPHNIVRHPDMPKALYAELWSTIQRGASWQGEIKNRRKDGSHYWVDVKIEAIRDATGHISGYTAIRQDITDKKAVEQLSITDNLTQLYNRMKMEQRLQQEIDRAQRYQHPLSLIIMDVDHFKQVNDRHGHQTGDAVLIEMASLLRQHVRATDVAGRWGGEEFMVICPETDSSGALVLAEKVRQFIHEHTFPVVGNKSASFGVASHLADEQLTSLISRADAALYRAKALGRNRVEQAVCQS